MDGSVVLGGFLVLLGVACVVIQLRWDASDRRRELEAAAAARGEQGRDAQGRDAQGRDAPGPGGQHEGGPPPGPDPWDRLPIQKRI